MPRRLKPRGYNKAAHDNHPGVTISEEWRGTGMAKRKVLMLRWREPLARGKIGARRAEVVKDKIGRPVTSRSDAHQYAVRKSEELDTRRGELVDQDPAGKEHTPDATWDDLARAHAKSLRKRGKREKTRTGYKQSWRFIKRWKARPAKPCDLTGLDLENFAAFVASRRNRRTGKPLSPSSVVSVLAHVKVRLGFGRRRLKCVRIDAETLGERLESPRKPKLEPVVLTSAKLCAILIAAAEYDADHPATTTFPLREAANTFPLLAFFMGSGCRRGEVEALRWAPTSPGAAESWIDFHGDRFLIFSTKTGRHRVLSFEKRPHLRKLLGFMHDRVDAGAKPFVFGGVAPLAINNRREVDGEAVRGRSLKRALRTVRANSGADWALKTLRSTTATYLCNSGLFQGKTYDVAGEMGHRHDVLLTKYAKPYTLPKDQARADSVEGVLGIEKEITSWLEAQAGAGGKLLKMRRA